MTELSAGVLLLIAVVFIAAAYIQGVLGLGFPMLTTPLIAMATDMRTAVILVLLPCLSAILTGMVMSGPVRPVLARYWMMPLYIFAGSLMGTRIFITYAGFPFALLLAAIIFVYLNLDRVGRAQWPFVRSHPLTWAPIFGVLAGMCEGTANISAPPLVIYYLAIGVSPAHFVQALNICFLTGKLTQFGALASGGGVSMSDWMTSLMFAPLVVAGTWCGVQLRRRTDPATYRGWLKTALLVIAFMLIVQVALDLR